MLDQTAIEVDCPWDSGSSGCHAVSSATQRQRSLIALASSVVCVTDVLEMMWMSQNMIRSLIAGELQFHQYRHQSLCFYPWKECAQVVGAPIGLDDKNEEE